MSEDCTPGAVFEVRGACGTMQLLDPLLVSSQPILLAPPTLLLSQREPIGKFDAESAEPLMSVSPPHRAPKKHHVAPLSPRKFLRELNDPPPPSNLDASLSTPSLDLDSTSSSSDELDPVLVLPDERLYDDISFSEEEEMASV